MHALVCDAIKRGKRWANIFFSLHKVFGVELKFLLSPNTNWGWECQTICLQLQVPHPHKRNVSTHRPGLFAKTLIIFFHHCHWCAKKFIKENQFGLKHPFPPTKYIHDPSIANKRSKRIDHGNFWTYVMPKFTWIRSMSKRDF